jgi:hypothetical protein
LEIAPDSTGARTPQAGEIRKRESQFSRRHTAQTQFANPFVAMTRSRFGFPGSARDNTVLGRDCRYFFVPD